MPPAADGTPCSNLLLQKGLRLFRRVQDHPTPSRDNNHSQNARSYFIIHGITAFVEKEEGRAQKEAPNKLQLVGERPITWKRIK